jgi:predicted SAM-dependent methyltransferase
MAETLVPLLLKQAKAAVESDISGKAVDVVGSYGGKIAADLKTQKERQEQRERNPNKRIRTLKKVNLCSGPVQIDGYINVDIYDGAHFVLDLEKEQLPFPDESVDVLVCISAINYFSRQRAAEIIKEVYRVLKPGGITRFAAQDLHIFAEKYLNNDIGFYFQKLPDGRDRFPGKTIGDKFNEFFYGFKFKDKHCKYVHDFESLRVLFEEAGFPAIERKKYCESIIPEIEQIDNRPEQMFFLDAIKGKVCTVFSNGQINKASDEIDSLICPESRDFSENDSEGMRNLALKLWDAGEKEKSWQCLLKVLEIRPDDYIAVAKCIEIMYGLHRFEDISKLCNDYLKLKPQDREAKIISEEVQKVLEGTQKNSEPDTMKRRKELDSIRFRLNTIRSDQEHLSACMKWLARDHEINGGKGAASAYYIDSQRWGTDYPETTGYIIPTFLCYHKLVGDKSYLNNAITMGDWEIAIQTPDGGTGEPVGLYGLRPRVFNTAQVILGWMALYKQTGQDKYLNAAVKAADWIVGKQDPDGKWTKNTYAGPRSYHSRVAWALLELYAVIKQERYRLAAERSINWVLSQGYDNGWFANTSLSDPNKPWTHLIGYVLVGLTEIYRLNNAQFDREKALSLLCNAAENLVSVYTKLKETSKEGAFLTLPETFDCYWRSSDKYSCITGNAQIEFFIRRIAKYVYNPMFQSVADALLDDLKRLHLLDGVTNPDISGGLPGSYPIGAGYMGYAIPNWGVKFFADSLLQRLLPENLQDFLG